MSKVTLSCFVDYFVTFFVSTVKVTPSWVIDYFCDMVKSISRCLTSLIFFVDVCRERGQGHPDDYA